MTSERYKRLRKRLGYTQEELAHRLGVTKRTIIKRENGGTITHEAELAMLLQVREK